MIRSMTVPIGVLVSLIVALPLVAHEANLQNSEKAAQCDWMITQASRQDFVKCETIYAQNYHECSHWANSRLDWLEEHIGVPCERLMVEQAIEHCANRGKGAHVFYHIHHGQCGPANGCSGQNGKPPPQRYWEDIDWKIICR